MNGTPHRTVDGFLDGLVAQAKGIGESIASTLDQPMRGAGLPTPGPHRVPGRYFDGNLDACMAYGQGICRALDVPPEAFGFPPGDLFGGFPGGFPRRFGW